MLRGKIYINEEDFNDKLRWLKKQMIRRQKEAFAIKLDCFTSDMEISIRP